MPEEPLPPLASTDPPAAPAGRIWLVAVLLLLTAATWLAWPWLSGQVTLPWDGKAHFQAQAAFLAQSLQSGQSPFWAPQVFAGHPQIADPQSLIFNLGTLLLALTTATPSFAMVDGLAFGSLVFGALAMLGYGRDRGWHPAAALVAALAFAFGGSAAWRIQHLGQILSLAYFPWAFWMLDRALARNSLAFGALSGLFAGLMVLGPDQVAYLGLVCLTGVVAAHWLAGPGRLARIRASLPPLMAGAGVGGGLIALPMLMVLAFADGSNRAQIALADAAVGSLHPSNLLTFVTANLFGTIGPGPQFWGAPSVHWPYIVNSNVARNMANVYTGLVPLAGIGAWLASHAAWLASHTALRRGTIGLVVLFALMIAYTLGRYTPVFPAAYALLPGADLFRRPADATFLVGALGAVLAGFGLDTVLRGGATWPPRRVLVAWLIVVATGLAGGLGMALWLGQMAIAGPALLASLGWLVLAAIALMLAARQALRRPVLAMVLLGGAVTADLGWNIRPNESTGLPPESYEALQPDGRNETITLLKRIVVRQEDRRDRIELTGLGFGWPNAGLVHDLETVLGYNPLRIAAYSRATGAGDHVALPEQRKFSALMPGYRSPLANLLGLRFIATGVPIETIDPALAGNPLPLVARTRDGFIYENPDALPRVMVVPEAVPQDQDELIRTGRWPGTDFRRTVSLDPAAGPVPPAATGGTARILRYRNTEVSVAVEAAQGGVLLLNDTWHPWWQAEIDGVPVPVWRANGIFRAVVLPTGAREVVFRFAPVSGVLRSLFGRDHKQKAG